MITPIPQAPATLGLGGGCHWCTEAVFQSLAGVTRVDQGWIASDPPHDAFSEAVIVHFQPSLVRLADLLEVHLHTHASQSDHSLREKYRSAIYVTDATQLADATATLSRLAARFPVRLVTRVLPLRRFRPSRDEITCYYATDPTRPFCRTYIEPKLQLLRQRFPHLLDSSGS